MLRLSLLLIGLLASPVHATDLVSPFAGSVEIGKYEVDFDRFQYLQDNDGVVEKVTAEGRVSSRIFTKPSDKSTFEVWKSYEKELTAAGFEPVAILDSENKIQQLSRQINKGNGINDIPNRSYEKDGKRSGQNSTDWLATFTEYYIAARKIEQDIEYLVVVLIADRKDLYAVDVLETAAMEQNTVALSLDAMRAQMASEGRIAAYGILFDTNSATLRLESDEALEVVGQYINENPGRKFYVVGHTDDQGALALNLKLSQARAEATVRALVGRFFVAEDQLSAHGVGPLSPVATNTRDDGRQLNRRVELVSSID